MKRVTAILFILLSLEACKKAGQPECTPARAGYSVLSDKNIVIRSDTAGGGSLFYRYQILDGPDLVFTFDYHYEVCPGTLDLDPYRRIAFQVPAGATAFDWADSSSLVQAKALVKNVCGECFGGIWFLTRGRLTGRKVSENTWAVQGSVSSYQNPSAVYKVEANFVRN